MSMNYHFYSAPFNLGALTRGKSLKTCNLGESISQHIMMMISTRKGELQSDPNFGSTLWNLEFELVVNQRDWEDNVAQSLEDGIRRYETRLKDVQIFVTFSEIEVTSALKRSAEIKKQARIIVVGKIKHSNKNFRFSTEVFVSPFSM